jgi:hypothetical protein
MDPITLALLIGIATTAYVAGAPDPVTRSVSRGAAGAVRSGGGSFFRALRSEWRAARPGPARSTDMVDAGDDDAPVRSGSTGRSGGAKKRTGSGKGKGSGSTRTVGRVKTKKRPTGWRRFWADSKGVGRRLRAVGRATSAGWSAAGAGYATASTVALARWRERREERGPNRVEQIIRDGAQRAAARVRQTAERVQAHPATQALAGLAVVQLLARRMNRTPDGWDKARPYDPDDPSTHIDSPEQPASEDTPTGETKESTVTDIPLTEGPGEYNSPGDMQADVDAIRDAANAVAAAQAHLASLISGMQEKYVAAGFTTAGLTTGVASLAESGEGGPEHVLETLPQIEGAVSEAQSLGEAAEAIEAEGEVPAYRPS